MREQESLCPMQITEISWQSEEFSNSQQNNGKEKAVPVGGCGFFDGISLYFDCAKSLKFSGESVCRLFTGELKNRLST